MRTEIAQFIDTLSYSRLSIDRTVPIVISSHGNSIVTWSSNVELSELFGKESTVEEYRIILTRRWYSTVLFDGSIIQLGYTFFGSTIIKHRLTYYPCPIRFSVDELDEYSIDELLDVFADDEFKNRVRLEGPLRFDYDPAAAKADHPASHLTISRSCCRIPVHAPLSIGHFVKFLFSNFYPDIWKDTPTLQNWACTTGNSCLPDLEDDRIYLLWKRRSPG
ncbi:MAG: DUF2290 domain-containing protein [Planctomycetia bacterium]